MIIEPLQVYLLRPIRYQLEYALDNFLCSCDVFQQQLNQSTRWSTSSNTMSYFFSLFIDSCPSLTPNLHNSIARSRRLSKGHLTFCWVDRTAMNERSCGRREQSAGDTLATVSRNNEETRDSEGCRQWLGVTEETSACVHSNKRDGRGKG